MLSQTDACKVSEVQSFTCLADEGKFSLTFRTKENDSDYELQVRERERGRERER